MLCDWRCRPYSDGADDPRSHRNEVLRANPRVRALPESDPPDGRRHSRKVWKPALAEIEDALVPAFIIEEFEDGRYTVFIPLIPTPLAGAVYILERKRVHPVDVPFTQAIQVVSRWGSGAKGLDLAMERASNKIQRCCLTEAPVSLV